LGLTTILWNLDTNDWAAGFNEPVSQVQASYEDFIAMGANGTFKNSGQITLTHEINNETMTLAMEFLPKIQAAYKNVVDVATCMNITNPYHESQVVFAAFGGAVASTTNGTAASGAAAGAATSAAAIAAKNASTSAGIQLSPNALVAAAFAVAVYFF
jgi:hypothetical protein